MVVFDFTFSAGSADVVNLTWVDALLSLAGLVLTAFGVGGTFGLDAASERVALVAEGAGADGRVLALRALRVNPAGLAVAGVDGRGGGGGTHLRDKDGASKMAVPGVALGTLALRLVVPSVAVCVEAASAGAAHVHALVSHAFLLV